MKTIIVFFGIVLAICCGTVLLSSWKQSQQPQTITITVTVPNAELILKGLSKLPYEESAALINDVTQQATRQLQPKQVDTVKPKKN